MLLNKLGQIRQEKSTIIFGNSTSKKGMDNFACF